MVKLSVVMISRNSAAHIQRALDSLKSQTNQDFEIVFVDCLSTDETMDIIKKFPFAKKRIICEYDIGTYDAMNKGIKKATGKIIYILNTDDILDTNNVFEEAVKLFDKDTDILYGDTLVPIKGKRTAFFFELNDKNLKRGLFPTQQCMFYRKTIFNKLNYHVINYTSAGDFEFFCRLNQHAKTNKCGIKAIPGWGVGYLMPGGGCSIGITGEMELGDIIRKYYGDWNFFVWKAPLVIKRFFRNILSKLNLLTLYRSTIEKIF